MSQITYEALEWTNVKRDPSTGLGTLVTLFEVLEQYLQTARSADQPLSLLHVDIDQLSRLNRNVGFVVADEMMSHMILSIRRLLEDAQLGYLYDELIYRIGGDEFAVLLPGVDIDRAAEFAETIRDRFSHESVPNATLRATLSIGVASVPDSAHDLGSLITAADMGVLEAKRSGRNSVHVHKQEPLGSKEMAVAARIINMLARRMVETGSLLEEAQRVAFTDPVSGLPNQRAMNRFLEREHQRAARYHRPYSLLLVDGDSLKKFNDALGHQAGNEWIRMLSQLLVRLTRTTDLVARWFSGDEFVVVLTETGAEDALATAERIRAEVERAGRRMPIVATVSIGVATYPEDGATINEILEHSDHANGEAKRRGRNGVVVYGSIAGEKQ